VSFRNLSLAGAAAFPLVGAAAWLGTAAFRSLPLGAAAFRSLPLGAAAFWTAAFCHVGVVGGHGQTLAEVLQVAKPIERVNAFLRLPVPPLDGGQCDFPRLSRVIWQLGRYVL